MAGGYMTYGQIACGAWVRVMETLILGAVTWASFADQTSGQAKLARGQRSWPSAPGGTAPDQACSPPGYRASTNAAVRGADSTWAMIYLASQCHVLIHLDKVLTPRFMTFINPPRRAGRRHLRHR